MPLHGVCILWMLIWWITLTLSGLIFTIKYLLFCNHQLLECFYIDILLQPAVSWIVTTMTQVLFCTNISLDCLQSCRYMFICQLRRFSNDMDAVVLQPTGSWIVFTNTWLKFHNLQFHGLFLMLCGHCCMQAVFCSAGIGFELKWITRTVDGGWGGGCKFT